jgi:uncharacterized membrane protein YjjB (DUF3815 family)
MIVEILIKSFWAGIAAIGFAILFNVPRRTLFPIGLLGVMGGIIKFASLGWHVNIVFASFWAAAAVGFVSIRMAHLKKSPPLIFSIPSVIPMVPGFFAYKFMLGLIALTSMEDAATYLNILVDTVNNGAKMMFVLIGLGTGVALPMLLTRKESIKKSKFNTNKKVSV